MARRRAPRRRACLWGGKSGGRSVGAIESVRLIAGDDYRKGGLLTIFGHWDVPTLFAKSPCTRRDFIRTETSYNATRGHLRHDAFPGGRGGSIGGRAWRSGFLPRPSVVG